MHSCWTAVLKVNIRSLFESVRLRCRRKDGKDSGVKSFKNQGAVLLLRDEIGRILKTFYMILLQVGAQQSA